MNDLLIKIVKKEVVNRWKQKSQLTRIELITIAVKKYAEVAKQQKIIQNIKTMTLQRECCAIVDSLIEKGKINPRG